MPIIWPTYAGPAEDDEHKVIESKAHEKLFDCITPNVLDNPQLVSYARFRRKKWSKRQPKPTSAENLRLVCCPRKAISNSLLAKGVVQHSQRQMTASNSSRTEAIHQVALDIRGSIRSSKNDMPCTPRQSELAVKAFQIFKSLSSFLSTILTGQ